MSECNNRCGGMCCKAFSLPLSPIELDFHAKMAKIGHGKYRHSDIEQIAEMVILVRNTPDHKAFRGYKKKQHVSHLWLYTCKNLSAEGLCMNYDNRPKMCKTFPDSGNCKYCNYKTEDFLKRELANAIEEVIPENNDWQNTDVANLG